MQKYVGEVIDVCGSGGDTHFWCDSTFRYDFRNIYNNEKRFVDYYSPAEI
jgi:hypothetical protein